MEPKSIETLSQRLRFVAVVVAALTICEVFERPAPRHFCPPSVVVCNHPEQAELEKRIAELEKNQVSPLKLLAREMALDERIKKLEARPHIVPITSDGSSGVPITIDPRYVTGDCAK